MRKTFVAPRLVAEASLATLTLVAAVSHVISPPPPPP
jgi:hypothetical protein